MLPAKPLPVARNRIPVHTNFGTFVVSVAGKAPGIQRWGKATGTGTPGAHTRGSGHQDSPQPSLAPARLSSFHHSPALSHTAIVFSSAQALGPGNLSSPHKRGAVLPGKDSDWPAWVTPLSFRPITFAKSGGPVISELAFLRKQSRRQPGCREFPGEVTAGSSHEESKMGWRESQ